MNQSSYNNSRTPSDDRSGLCGMLFRQGNGYTEYDFQPDMDLVYEMRDRGIRVQDILNALKNLNHYPPQLEDFILWWERRGAETPLTDPT